MHSSGILRRLVQLQIEAREWECSSVLLRLLNPLFAIALKRKNTLRRILCSRRATLSSALSRRCRGDTSRGYAYQRLDGTFVTDPSHEVCR